MSVSANGTVTIQLGDAYRLILMILLILLFDLKKEIHNYIEDSLENRYGNSRDKLTEFDL